MVGKKVFENQRQSPRGGGIKMKALLAMGDDTALEKHALAYLKDHPKDLPYLCILTDLYLGSDRPEKSRALWEDTYPSLFEPNAKLDESTLWEASDIARTLLATGEEERASYLLSESLAIAKTLPPSPNSMVLEATLHVLAGDEEKALETVLQDLDAGVSPSKLRDSGYVNDMKSILDSPEYQAKAAELGYAKEETERAAQWAVEAAKQLKRIREMEANGELAPIPELVTGLRTE